MRAHHPHVSVGHYLSCRVLCNKITGHAEPLSSFLITNSWERAGYSLVRSAATLDALCPISIATVHSETLSNPIVYYHSIHVFPRRNADE